jgi:hypothetical protein
MVIELPFEIGETVVFVDKDHEQRTVKVKWGKVVAVVVSIDSVKVQIDTYSYSLDDIIIFKTFEECVEYIKKSIWSKLL